MPYQNEELVASALQELDAELEGVQTISFTTTINRLKDIIVEEYDQGMSIAEYKDLWVTRINGIAASHGFEMSTSSPSWVRVEPDLIAKSNTSTAPLSTTPNVSSSSSSSSYTLTAEDKKCIEKVYQNLDPSKMWKLSTGTIVEKQMEELARTCDVEHPCHSLILDVNDEIWLDYFTEEELAEIRNHKAIELIPTPSVLKGFLGSLVQRNDADEMHDDISQTYYEPKVNSACYWAQKTLLDGLDLHNSGFFRSLSYHSERDFVNRVWIMMLTSFDYSRITAREEIYSDACSAEMNKTRRLDPTSPLSKKKYSKRLDHLYSFTKYELGFLEAAMKSDGHSNKEDKDALITSPKTMKDFLIQLTRYNPNLIRSIWIPCLITSALDIKLLILDAPEGYVCRVSSTKTYGYPSAFSTFIRDIIPCLELGWMNKSIMEQTVAAPNAPARITVSLKRKRSSGIPSCFVRGSKKPAPNVPLNVDSATP